MGTSRFKPTTRRKTADVSTAWSIFIVVGTLGSLGALLWLLFATHNRAEKSEHGDFDGIEEHDNPLPTWWIGWFVATIVFAAVYVVYYPALGSFRGVGGWTAQAELARDQDLSAERVAPLHARLGAMNVDLLIRDPEALRIGRRLFLNHCAPCHGVDARGAFGFPNLTDEEWSWDNDFAAIEATITTGRIAAMPPWGAALGERGVTDMAHYVMQLASQAHDADAAARAAPQFATFCSACHGSQGKGTPASGVPDLTNATWLYGSSLEEVAFTIRHGRTGHMPAQRDVLSPQEIRAIAAYVFALREAT